MYATSTGEVGLLHLAAALLQTLPPDAVVTGVTALHLYGVEVGDPLPLRTVTATGIRNKRADVRLIRATELPPHRGRLATAVASWTAASVELDLLQAVTAGDWLVGRGLTSEAGVLGAAEEARGRGCRQIRRAALLVRARVDSPRETRLRLSLVLAGLPAPRCNITLGNDLHAIGRVDLLYDEFKVILEYDGDRHRKDRSQWNNDLDRNDAFADLGYLVIRVTGARMAHPREVVRRVFAKLRERGYAGPPPVFSAEWCVLFEPARH